MNKKKEFKSPEDLLSRMNNINITVSGEININKYLKKHIANFKKRDFLIDIFTVCEHTQYDPDTAYIGQIITYDKIICGIDAINEEGVPTLVKLSDKHDVPLCNVYDKIELEPGDLTNISTKTITIIGRMLTNYLLLADPFGDMFPYINDIFNADKIENEIVQAVLSEKISVSQIKDKYIPNIYFIGHFSEMFVPTYSAKSISSSPEVDKRRAELLEQYADQLDDPLVMLKIEDELIDMDKAYLKGDVSEGYFNANSKAYGISRKKTMVAGGMLEDQYSKSGYTYIKDPYDRKFEKENFAVMCNDIRRGTYHRAINTAKGGEQVEFMRRVFQDSRITADDCKTKRGFTTTLSAFNIDDYMYCYIMTPQGLELLTKDNKSKYVNKTVTLRSPGYCKQHNGYCKICMGKKFTNLDIDSLTMTVAGIGSKFLGMSMRAMHGSKTKLIDIKSLEKYVI